jgi:N-acetylmuramoyl-L-alanine amidase
MNKEESTIKKDLLILVKINKNTLIQFIIIVLLLIIFFLIYIGHTKKSIEVYNIRINETVVIDPGHGGIDGGTHYNERLLEKDINLDVSLKLREILENNNINVIMTRDKDVSLENKCNINASRYRRDLTARKNIVNKNNTSLFVSIHVNANCYDSDARGVIIYYYPGSEKGKLLAENIGYAIDKIVYREYLNYKNIESKAVAEDYFILRETKAPGVIVEMGFITNPYDRRLLENDGYRRKIAEGIYKGIIEYLKENK